MGWRTNGRTDEKKDSAWQGRKPVALAGIVGLGLGLGALAVSSSGWMPGVPWAPWLSVCGILVFRLSFSCSLGPVPYVVAAEVGGEGGGRCTSR